MPAGDIKQVGEYQRRMSYLDLGRLYREGLGAPQAKLGASGQVELQIAGVAGVPDIDVSAVVLNGGTHLVADVAGYYMPAFSSTDGRLQTATPERILDTREGLGAPKAKLLAGQQIDLQVTGRGPVPQSGVEAVVINVTGDQSSFAGFVTAWPTGIDRPVVSNLNLALGETRANLVVVPVGIGGKVSLFTSGGTDLIADVAGWFTDLAHELSHTQGGFDQRRPSQLSHRRRRQHHGHPVGRFGLHHRLAISFISTGCLEPQHHACRPDDPQRGDRSTWARQAQRLPANRRSSDHRHQRLVHQLLRSDIGATASV